MSYTMLYQNPRTRRFKGCDLRFVEIDGPGSALWLAVYVGRKRQPLWRRKYLTTTDREDAVQMARYFWRAS